MKRSILGVLVILACLIGISAAIVAQQYDIPQSAIISDVMTVTIDQVQWTQGQPLDWGQLIPGSTNIKSMQIDNIATFAITITVTTADLPLDWTQDWASSGVTIQPNLGVVGDLTLIIPSNAPANTYDWSLYIIADKVA